VVRRFLFLLACVALAGCGGDDRLSGDEYRQKAAPPVRDAADAIVKLGIAISRAPAPELAASRLELLRRRLGDASGALAELSAPKEIDDAHGALVEALADLSDEVATYEDEVDVELEEYEQLTTFGQELSATAPAKEITEALRELAEAGFPLLR